MRFLGAILGAAIVLSASDAATAQFEVEGPEVERGEVELRYDGQYNFGIPRRRAVEVDGGGEVVADDNEQARQAHAFQFGMGLTDWFSLELGIEFEEERREEVRFLSERNDFIGLKATEVELQTILELVPLEGNGFGLSLLTEASHSTAPGEGNSIGIGPIVKWQQGPFSATANLIFAKSFGGEHEEEEDGGETVVEERTDDRWDFNYGWQLSYQLNSKFALAVEGFGTVERLGDSGWAAQASDEIQQELADVGVSSNSLLRDHDQHRIGPVLYYKLAGEAEVAGGGDDEKAGEEEDEAPSLTLGVGVLFGLNEDTPDAALKWSLEAEF